MKKLIFRTLVAVLALPIWFTAGTVVVHAQEATCPEPTPVTIDIKPGDPSNTIHLSARGFLPVAVLTTSQFDARRFTPEMAHLNDASIAASAGCSGPQAVYWNYADVNRDGRADLVFFFRIRDLNLTPTSTAATLMAHGSYNSTVIHIMGTDAVRVRR